MSGISSLQNTCIYSLGPALSGQVSESLQSQITGMKNLQKHQVNQAIYIDSNVLISKTSAALQNVAIASQFCNTTVASLQTVEASLTDALNASMTLLNGTVSDANKASAADSIIDAVGMKHGAKSRDAQEGSVIKTLRQSGTGVSPFYTMTTAEGTPPSPDAAPPEAVDSTGGGSVASVLFNGTGIVPPQTFASAQTIQFTGFSADDCGDIDPSTATIVDGSTDMSAAGFTLTVGGKVFASEHLDLATNTAARAINLYDPDDKGKYITFFTAGDADATSLKSDVEALPAFQALFTGSIGTSVQNASSAVFTSACSTAPSKAFADPATSPPKFSGVEAGAIQVLSATLAAPTKLVVQVGQSIYATSDSDALDLTALSDVTLYLDGDASSASTIELTQHATDPATTDAELLTAFTAYMKGTLGPVLPANTDNGIFFHDGTPVASGGLAPCNAGCFTNVPAGEISVDETATKYSGDGTTVDGKKVAISVNVGGNIYSTDGTTYADITAGNVVLMKDGTDTTSTITLLAGPIANVAPAAGPPVVPGTGVCDDATLIASVKEALSGSFNAFGATSGGASTPFVFTPGSNYGAGYFTLKYDGINMHFYDQFGDIVQSWPVSEEEILESVVNDGGRLSLGDIGTLYTDASYKGGAFEKKLTTTASREFSTTVTVSGNDGARRIIIPNLTDQRTLYGISTTIDHERLVQETAYQKEIKGMIEHALLKVKETIQYVSNINNSLAADERGQNASMSSLQSLKDVVSETDPIETANAVFESSQAYNSMVNAMYIAATITAQETRSSLQIAQLAAAG